MNIFDIKQYVFKYADSNMFVVAENNSALIIDPNISDEALNYLQEQKVLKVTIMLTHEHYDHTSGLTWICDKFKSSVICQEQTAVSLRDGKNNRPIVIAASKAGFENVDEFKRIVHSLPQGYRYNADITFSDTYSFNWNNHKIHLISTPGHSLGSCCIEIDDNIIASGDTIIPNTPIITRFIGGNEKAYNEITIPYLSKIPDNTLILPGHGKITLKRDC